MNHAGDRFPYKSPAGSTAVSHAVELALSRVWIATLDFAWKRAQVFRFNFQDAEDLAAAAMMDVCSDSLSAFDSSRGMSLESFLIFCARNRVKNHLRSLWLRRMREAASLDHHHIEQLAGPSDTFEQREADELAGRIMADASSQLNASDASFLNELLDSPHLTNQQHAKRLGMTAPAYRGALARVRKRVTKIAERTLGKL